jgi:hypothetical protein
MKHKYKTIQIGDYIFNLTFFGKPPHRVLSSNFALDIHHDRDMTQKEMDKGRQLQQEIFAEKHKELIDNTEWR